MPSRSDMDNTELGFVLIALLIIPAVTPVIQQIWSYRRGLH
jgi:hypothetical protein